MTTQMFMLGRKGEGPTQIKTADIAVVNTGQSWRVKVNDKWLAEYPHRVSYAEAHADAMLIGSLRKYGLPVYCLPMGRKHKDFEAAIVGGLNLGEEVARAVKEDLAVMLQFSTDFKIFEGASPAVADIIKDFFASREDLIARLTAAGYEF